MPAIEELPEGHPRWLWDVKNFKTVIVEELQVCPPYTCVSHTWGRWRKSTSVEVEGVSGWEVPENYLYDVRELPQELSQLKCHYIWLDLFCIPQDNSRAADEEIARQSSIFRRAERCIAWIHDIKAWNDVVLGIKFLALQYLTVADRTVSIQALADRLQHDGKKPIQHDTGLMQNPSVCQTTTSDATAVLTSPQTSGRLEPSTWFSSLWTLQEAVLCPNMQIFTKDWERLEDATGEGLTLLSVASFLHLAFSYSTQGDAKGNHLFDFWSHAMNPIGSPGRTFGSLGVEVNAAPPSVTRLSEFLDMTRLDNVLFNSSPVSIMFNANVRRCTGNRAPAIMSAIGVTDWYTKQLSEGKVREYKVEDLVLRVYPLDFVQEACAKTGARFFETTFTISEKRMERTLKGKRAIGSMLPFSRPNGWLFRKFGPPEVARISIYEHSAVRNWEIQQNGTVSIHTAGILIDPKNENSLKMSGSLLWFVESEHINDGYTDDFYADLKLLAGDSVIHAVCLYQDGQVQHGIILQEEHGRHCEGGLTYLVRVGIYWVCCNSVRPELPEVAEVNWIVL
ncbi:heterokaryon incompatibility protein-domain-containing protein [Lophiotrema nucula]|uniref:Heterokaryon incompatibility protein-domain-containing protein n=1 Tax=Lophiotrema nucula TaxID=690887 RepID=A0A6A5ZSV8_9PLEO|nr:heterokaryon incompatibility protein-domain-containing protein [Lophiotrema nucula]